MNAETKDAPDRSLTSERETVAHVTYTLACCGLVMQHKVAREFTPAFDTPQRKTEARQTALDRITFWLADRVANHDCALVSPENPNGNRRKIMGIKEAAEARVAAGWRE